MSSAPAQRHHVLANGILAPGANIGHSRSWAAGNTRPPADNDTDDDDEAWENDFNFDVVPEASVPHSSSPTRKATTRVKVERLALNFRLVDIVGRAFDAINELVDEAVKVNEVCSQFKEQRSVHLDDDDGGSTAWLDQVLQLLVECSLHVFRADETSTVIDQFDRASSLIIQPDGSVTRHIPRHMVTVVQLWLKVEKYALHPPHEKELCYQSVTSSVASAVLQMKLLDNDAHKNNPHFALTVVALNEMSDATAKTHAVSPKKQPQLPKYPSDASMSPSKPTQQLETVFVLRLALLSVVLMGYKHHSRRQLPLPLVSSLTLCTAHLLLLTFEIPLAMDFACLTSKIAAYLTLDDSALARAKAVLCQAQTDLQSLHDEDKDWADFDEHERSQRMFSVDWTATGQVVSAKNCRVQEVGKSHDNPAARDGGDDGGSDSSSDWDADEPTKAPSKSGTSLQHPSVSASSLSTVLNLRDLFVPMKEPKTASWNMMLTQVMEHPPLDAAAPLPPPSSPYSRSFAAFETGNVLNNSFQSTRSMDQWLRDLAFSKPSNTGLPHLPHLLDTPDAIGAHLAAIAPKFTPAWLDLYELTCRRAAASAPDVCLQLVQTFFNDVETSAGPEGKTNALLTNAASPLWFDTALRLCALAAESAQAPHDVCKYLSMLRSMASLDAADLPSRVLANLRCTLVEIEVRVHHALISEDDFMDHSLEWTSIFGALRDASTRLHAHAVACRSTPTQPDDEEDSMVSDVLELSMHVLVITQALWSGISPLSLKSISKAPPPTPACSDDDLSDLDKLTGVSDFVAYFADHPMAASAGGTWHRLKLLYPQLPLTSPIRVRAGLLMGMSLWSTYQNLHDAESILYESIYVLHTHFTLHSSVGVTALIMFGDALLGVGKYEFATAAMESACHIAHGIDATACVVELERKLAVLCSDHGDVERSIRYYKRIRARSLAQRVWFEYVYLTVTMACLLMDMGEYAAAAQDIHPVLQQMQLLATYDSDVVTELQVLSIRLSICHLKLHCPHRAISTLELCIQHFHPRAAKHAVVLLWLAKCYYKANQFPHCELTLKTVAKLRKDHKLNHGSTGVVHGGSFAKLPPPLKFSIPATASPDSSMASDLYPLHTQVALKLSDYERAAHYSALSIVYLELQAKSATTLTQLGHVFYLRGKVLQAAATAPWLFPMKLQSLECEQLLPTKPSRALHRRKSSVLVRERVLVSLDECMYHSLRAFHRSYELFSGQNDKVGMMKAACQLSRVYLHKVFLPRVVLHRPLDQLMKFSLTRRQHAASSSQDVKAPATVDFEFSLSDIESPTKFVWDLSVVAMAPRLYMEACLNMCQLHCLREKGADALGYWYEARDVFLNCVLCPSASSMRRSLARLVETLLAFDSSIIKDNVVLLELWTTPWSSWRHAPFLKKTDRRRGAMMAETSTSYQAKLREKRPKPNGGGGHQRHKSDTLELLTTKHLHGASVGGSARSLSSSTSRTPDTTTFVASSKGGAAAESAPNPPLQSPTPTSNVEMSIHHNFAMLKHHRDKFTNHPDDDGDAKSRRVMRRIWDLMEDFRGKWSLSAWLSSVGYDKDTMATVVYALDIVPASVMASYVPATGVCEWKWIEPPNQLTLLSATGPAQPPPHAPLRRFHIDESKALPPPLSAPIVPDLFATCSSDKKSAKQLARDLDMFGREFSLRLPLMHTRPTDTFGESTTRNQSDAQGNTTPRYSVVCSPSLQSLPWELLPGTAMVRCLTALVVTKTRPDESPVYFRVCRVKSRHLHATEALAPWWTVLGYTSTLTLTRKKVKFSKKVTVVSKTALDDGVPTSIASPSTAPPVDIILVSLLELNGATSWVAPTPSRMYMFAPPLSLPLLSKALLKSLPQVKKPSIFAKRQPPPTVVTASSVLQTVHGIVSAFQAQQHVPVVVYSVNPW